MLGGCSTFYKVGTLPLASLSDDRPHEFLLGNFKETSSPEHQLQCILNNCVLVQEANGINNIVEAIKIANGKHDLLR